MLDSKLQGLMGGAVLHLPRHACLMPEHGQRLGCQTQNVGHLEACRAGLPELRFLESLWAFRLLLPRLATCRLASLESAASTLV